MSYSPVWAALGAAIVVAVVYDFYVTTVTLSGGGPLSTRLSKAMWNTFLGWHNRTGTRWVLSTAGPVIFLMMIALWFGLCWLGWFLVFCGAEGSVVSAQSLDPANRVDRFYYAGYTLTTIGYGDFKAPNSAGQIASIVAGLNGLLLVTLAITYSMPVVSASVERRQLALLIRSLGSSTPEMIDRSYSDGSFSFLDSQLSKLNAQIASVSQKHLAYPMVHYFHDDNSATALPLNLVRLYEAVNIVLASFPELPDATRSQLLSTVYIVEKFLKTLYDSLPDLPDDAHAEVPDIASSHALKESALSLEAIAEQLLAKDQRRWLLAYARSDGWSWSDVHFTSDTE